MENYLIPMLFGTLPPAPPEKELPKPLQKPVTGTATHTPGIDRYRELMGNKWLTAAEIAALVGQDMWTVTTVIQRMEKKKKLLQRRLGKTKGSNGRTLVEWRFIPVK